jgi:hypothetical protein
LDTAIIVGVMIGSVVAIVLVFGKTVLGIAWTENDTCKLKAIRTRNRNRVVQEHLQHTDDDTRRKVFSNQDQNKNEKSKKSLQVEEKSNNFDSLLNKEVSTCDNVIIGSINAVHNGLMIIIFAPQSKRYEIPTYYVREHDQNSVLVDISAGDLEHYKPQATI